LLIIFDLDDTLVDTSGCLIYHKLEEALVKMVQAGLNLSDFKGALAQLRRLNDVAPSSKEALAEFIEILGVDSQFLNIALQEMYSEEPSELALTPLEGALELLEHLRVHHTLALVTRGNPKVQMQKLEKAGIDSPIFSKILITQEMDKKRLYKELIDELDILPSHVFVCGDRVCPDLTPARELGCRTVHVKWGRGSRVRLPHPDIDYSISALADLKGIIAMCSSF
jgi:putative hydrolase of the HAD superfamily